MELFRDAITVKFSHNDKYLVAEDDQESVRLDRDGSLKTATWAVEIAGHNYLRFKSFYGKYLTASNGKKVLQTLPKRADSSTEWEPLRDGFSVRLKTPFGSFLRPHGGLPPRRNSVTHDVPQRMGTQEKILWHIDVPWAVPRPRTTPSPLPSPSQSPLPPSLCRVLSLNKNFPTERTPPTLEPLPNLARKR